MNGEDFAIRPVVVLTLGGRSEGWLTKAQAAAFFGVAERELPVLIEKGLPPPVRLTHKNSRFALADVMAFSEQLRAQSLSVASHASKTARRLSNKSLR